MHTRFIQLNIFPQHYEINCNLHVWRQGRVTVMTEVVSDYCQSLQKWAVLNAAVLKLRPGYTQNQVMGFFISVYATSLS
jgi:hypothetical protein